MSTKCGISSRHGAHHVAQKSSRTTLPLYSESDSFLPWMSVTVKSGAPAPACPFAGPEWQPISAEIHSDTSQQTTTLFFKTHSPFGCGIPFVHPVGAEIVGDVEHPHVGVSEVPQLLIGGVNVGTTVPWAAAAIHHNQGVFGQCCHPRL